MSVIKAFAYFACLLVILVVVNRLTGQSLTTSQVALSLAFAVLIRTFERSA